MEESALSHICFGQRSVKPLVSNMFVRSVYRLLVEGSSYYGSSFTVEVRINP